VPFTIEIVEAKCLQANFELKEPHSLFHQVDEVVKP